MGIPIKPSRNLTATGGIAIKKGGHAQVPAISLRENERGMQIEAGWNPHYRQASDVYSTYSDKDFRLGLNAAQTTLGAVAELTGAQLK